MNSSSIVSRTDHKAQADLVFHLRMMAVVSVATLLLNTAICFNMAMYVPDGAIWPPAKIIGLGTIALSSGGTIVMIIYLVRKTSRVIKDFGWRIHNLAASSVDPRL